MSLSNGFRNFKRSFFCSLLILSARALIIYSSIVIKERKKRLLYMIIERFKTPGAIDVYRRAKDQGRLMPQGLEYVSSWVDFHFTRCFQLMKTEDEKLLDQWISNWTDLVDFEIIPVQTSAEAMDAIKSRI